MHILLGIRLVKKNHIDDGQTFQVKRFFIKNYKPESYPKLIQSLAQENPPGDLYESFELLQARLNDDSWRLYSPVTQGIIEKIEKKTPFTLDNVVHSFQGIITGNDKAFIFEQTDPALCAFDPALLKPWIKNKDVRAYQVSEPQKRILYTNRIGAVDQYPQVAAHLENHRDKLANRRECKNGNLAWYKPQWGRDPDHFEGRKIVFPYKATQNHFAIDENKCYFSADVYGLILKSRLYHQVNEEFLVLLLNSRLYNYYFKSYGKKLGDKLYEYYPNTLLRLGIPDIKNETIKYLKDEGLWVCGTDMNTNTHYYDQDFKMPIAIVIGSEGFGMSRLVKDNCDFLVKIPMKGKITSLNAAVYAGIVIYEVVEQRIK